MKILVGLLLSFSFSLAGAATASSFAGMCNSDKEIQVSRGGGGDPTPWPWGMEIKMSWSTMSGVWQPMADGCSSNFIFKAGKPTPSGERLMTITQFDPATCKITARGAGYESNNIVYASMISGDKTFDLTIRAFNESDVKANMRNAFEQVNRRVVVIHMYPKGDWDSRVSYEVTKVKNTSEVSCKNFDK